MVRGPQREHAILSATLAELGKHGYESMTIDGVAATARASKATIYRRWANKAQLVKAALDAQDAKDSASIPDTGELRSDLLATMRALRDKASKPYIDMMVDLVGAARRDPTLNELLREHVEKVELSPFQEVLARAAKRRTLPRSTDAELVHEVTEALIVRQIQAGLALDDAFITRVVDRVVLPLLGPKKSKT